MKLNGLVQVVDRKKTTFVAQNWRPHLSFTNMNVLCALRVFHARTGAQNALQSVNHCCKIGRQTELLSRNLLIN